MKAIKKLFLLCLLCTTGMTVWADDEVCPNNQIWYYTAADEPLAETTDQNATGIHTNAFNVTLKSHELVYYHDGIGKGILTFDGDVTTIGAYAFRSCNVLHIDLPASVTTIGCGAFNGCKASTVVIPDAVTAIGDEAFYGCPATSIILPEALTSIGKNAFQNCNNIKSIVIPDAVTEIGDYAFSYCTVLEDITLGKSLKTIGAYAFGVCRKLASITIPGSVTSIGKDAFQICSKLKKVTLHSFPEFGTSIFSSSPTVTLELSDAEHPYIAATTANAPTIKSAKYTRTLGEGELGTITLPFLPDNLSDYTFFRLYDAYDDTLVFSVVESKNVMAGVPYLYKNADDANISTAMTANGPVAITVETSDLRKIGDWQMYGTLRSVEASDNSFFVVEGDGFVNATTGTQVNPMHAYLTNTAYAPAKAFIKLVDDGGNDYTGIDAAKLQSELCSQGAGSREQVAGTAYDLSGRKVQLGQSGQLAPSVPSGLYIIGGKKVMVR